MSNRMRFVLAVAAGIIVTLVAATLTAPEGGGRRLPEYWAAPAFELTDQAGRPLRRADLLGTVWIASFIFTGCTDVCPAITARMARLADELDRERVLGDQVRLVSFSVDPERDTPDVLTDYARGFGDLPPAEWAFLTGAPGDSLRALVQEGFHLTAMRGETGEREREGEGEAGHGSHATARATTPASYQVMHAPRVLLVDRAGVVRGIYDATDPESMNHVVPDALRLLRD